MDFNKIAQINLRNGSGGGNPQDGLCIMEMVSYFDGADRVTDRPACACPFLTNIAIAINDRAPSQEDRDTLKPLLPLLTGSLDPERRQARGWFFMREINLRILAVRLDKINRGDLSGPIRAADDPATLRVAVNKARDEMRAAFKKKFPNADADAYAYANANAYADAYADANANAYANAYAYANANAYANAYADADANARLEDRRWVFSIMRDILTEALMLGNHGTLDPVVFERRADELAKVLAP